MKISCARRLLKTSLHQFQKETIQEAKGGSAFIENQTEKNIIAHMYKNKFINKIWTQR